MVDKCNLKKHSRLAFQGGTHRAAEEDKKAVRQGQAKIVQLGSALSARLQPASC